MLQLPLNEAKLKTFIKHCKHYNVFPAFFSQYFPKKRDHPITDSLAELVEEALQYLSILTHTEVDRIVDSFPPAIKMFVGNRDFAGNDRFLERVALYYLVAVVQEDYLSFKEIITSTDSEVLRIYPELQKKLDKDGLLHIDDDLLLFDGGIEYKDHILHYHQFLRRGFQSNPNFDFLGPFSMFCYLSGSKDKCRIAIDHHRIMPKEFYQQLMEMDVWRGPTFDRSKLDDPNAVGLTVVKRATPSYFEMWSAELDRTEFYWSYDSGVKSFEIEEVSGASALYGPYYLNRYVHSERDINLKVLRHFDGAVKVYLQDSYKNRLSSYMPTELKFYKKVKLFRIDGDINLDVWINLISQFFKMNETVIEYFSPEEFEERFGEKMRLYKAYKEEQTPSSPNV